MLRRFELYSLQDAAPTRDVERLRAALRDCSRFIPEVRSSAVGWIRPPAPLQLAWEHAFDSPEAYRRYMVHPFHAAVLDRYLLGDSPERVVSDNGLGAGLVGYDGDHLELAAGVRRLVLLRLRDDAARRAWDLLADLLRAAPAEVATMRVSVAAENRLATRWFDGVTALAPALAAWTHLWEQGFGSFAELDAYVGGASSVASLERRWREGADDVVDRVLDIAYEIEPAAPADRPRRRFLPSAIP